MHPLMRTFLINQRNITKLGTLKINFLSELGFFNSKKNGIMNMKIKKSDASVIVVYLAQTLEKY